MNMKKISAVLTLILLAVAPLSARTALELFVDAPDGIVPLLGHAARMDMADYHRYNLPTPTENELGGGSRIAESTEGSLLVEMSPSSSVQFGVLPLRGDTLAVVVETVLTPQSDSSIRFYRVSDWTEVNQRNSPVGKADFLPAGAIAADVPLLFAQARFEPEQGIFVFTNTTAGYFHDSDRPEVVASMRQTVKRRFDGKKWITVSEER